MDEELFMQELEEDEEVRAQVQIYRDPNAAAAAAAPNDAGDNDESDDDVPEVPIESLLDGLTLGMRRGGAGGGGADAGGDDDDAYVEDDDEMAD